MDGTCSDFVPVNVAERLRAGFRDSARRNLILTSQLLGLLDAFAVGGVPVVPLKGPALAESLYPDPAQRISSDLDFLIRKKDFPLAVRVLSEDGYTLAPHLARLRLSTLLDVQYELVFRHDRLGHVDLQWDTGLRNHPFRFDPDILWRSLGRTHVAGREVSTLSPESLLLFLCVHGTKHMWSRLQWLGDVARLVQTQPDWACVLELAAEAKCSRPLMLGLLLAHDLLESPIPSGILEGARAERTVRAQAMQLSVRLLSVRPVEPLSFEFTLFNARMAERTWDKMRYFAAKLKAPTETELEWINLPEGLFFLYYPARVARVALHYGKHLPRG